MNQTQLILVFSVLVVVAVAAYWIDSMQYLHVKDLNTAAKEIAQEFNTECKEGGEWNARFLPNKTIEETISDLNNKQCDRYIQKVPTVTVLGKIGKLVKCSIPNRCCGIDNYVHILVPAKYRGKRGTLDVTCRWSKWYPCGHVPEIT